MTYLDDALNYMEAATISVDAWLAKIDASKPYNYSVTNIYKALKALEAAAAQTTSVSPSSSQSSSTSPSISSSVSPSVSKSSSPSPSPSVSPSPSASLSPSASPSPSAAGGSSYDAFKGLCIYRTDDFAKAVSLVGSKHARCDWPSDATMAAAKTAGVEVLPIFDYAHGHAASDHAFPTDVPGWIADAVAFVNKYQPRAVELWNEPWGFTTSDPVAYWNFLKPVIPALWKAKPDLIQVVCMDKRGDYLDRLLAADTGKLLADPRIRGAVHNYSWPLGVDQTTADHNNATYWDFDRYKYTHADMLAHGHPTGAIWITEYGVESDKSGEAGQRDYCVAAIKKMQATGYIERAYAFHFKTGDAWSYNWLRMDGTIKPVGPAVKILA